jgi:hypothetical protein
VGCSVSLTVSFGDSGHPRVACREAVGPEIQIEPREVHEVRLEREHLRERIGGERRERVGAGVSSNVNDEAGRLRALDPQRDSLLLVSAVPEKSERNAVVVAAEHHLEADAVRILLPVVAPLIAS